MGCLELANNIQSLRKEIFLIKDQLKYMPYYHSTTKELEKYLTAKTIECDHLMVLDEWYKLIDSKSE